MGLLTLLAYEAEADPDTEKNPGAQKQVRIAFHKWVDGDVDKVVLPTETTSGASWPCGDDTNSFHFHFVSSDPRVFVDKGVHALYIASAETQQKFAQPKNFAR